MNYEEKKKTLIEEAQKIQAALQNHQTRMSDLATALSEINGKLKLLDELQKERPLSLVPPVEPLPTP